MTQKETMSLFETALANSNYSGKALTPLGMLSALSTAQAFLGNHFRLKTKEHTLELVGLQADYFFDIEGGRDGFPKDILEFKNIVYNGSSVAIGDSRELKKFDMSSVVNTLSAGSIPVTLGYAFEETILRLNFLPPTDYEEGNNETLTLRYYHKFLPYAGLDNYDWEVLPEYSKEMVLGNEYIPYVVQYAVISLSKENLGSYLSLLGEVIPRLRGETTDSSLKYHLGI